ncbi:MAG: hypothetical protein JO255_03835 [Alphaproteobacteria bacterium]|nr:hypothetical protein [Alphaproteobacteria bacterium]
MRSLLLAIVAMALAACWSSAEPPHSEYYVVFFDAAGSTLLPEGRSAIQRAVRDAKSGAPRAVTIKGYVDDDDASRHVAERRMQAVEEALIEAGLKKDLVKMAPEKTDPKTFAQLGDGVVVQIARGEDLPFPPPQSETPTDDGAPPAPTPPAE